MKISKKERNLIDFLIKQPVSKEDKDLIGPYNENALDFPDYLYILIDEDKFYKYEETIDSLGNKFLLIEIKKEAGVLRFMEPIIKYCKHTRYTLRTESKEEVIQVNYIMQLLSEIKNHKNEIYTEKQKRNWLYSV